MLVMPFDNVNRDVRISWVGEAASVLLADDLNALGVDAITRSERVSAFEQLHLPALASLSHATVIKVGQLVGATDIVVGSLALGGDELTVRVRRIQLDVGQMKPEVLERGPLEDLFAIFERVARRLGAAGGADVFVGSGAPAPPNPPLRAFEDYIKGLLAEQPATQIKYLESALKLHPDYDEARLALWEVHEEQGDYQQALQVALAVPEGSRAARDARFRASLSELELKKYDEGFATLKALNDEQPSAALYNNLGVVQVRRGSTPQAGRPTYFFNKASEADPTDPDYFFNLGYAYWIDRDMPAVIYWLREAVRRNPADGDAHFVLGAALQAIGSEAEAAREKELARRLSSKYAEWERRPSAGTEPVPRGLERIKRELPPAPSQRADTTRVSPAQRDQQELAAFYLNQGRRLFEQEKDQAAVADLRRAVYLSPYQPEAHLLLGRIYLRTARLGDAISALKISLWSEETVSAHVALGEAYLQRKDVAGARDEVQRALALDPASVEAKDLLARLDQAGVR